MEKKKNTGLIVLIVILVILLLGTSGYIAYDKFLATTNKNAEQEELDEVLDDDKVEDLSLEVDSNIVRKLYNNISRALDYANGVDMYYTNQKITTNNIDNLLAYQLAMSQIYYDKGIDIFKNNSVVTAEEVALKVKNILGKDYNFEHKSYKSCPEFKYDESAKNYIPTGSICGTVGGPSNYKKIVKAIKNDDSIELYVRVLFVDIEGEELPYYEDFNKTKKVSSIERDWENILSNDVNSNITKGSLYKLVFTEEDDNYVFTSSELVK